MGSVRDDSPLYLSTRIQDLQKANQVNHGKKKTQKPEIFVRTFTASLVIYFSRLL